MKFHIFPTVLLAFAVAISASCGSSKPKTDREKTLDKPAAEAPEKPTEEAPVAAAPAAEEPEAPSTSAARPDPDYRFIAYEDITKDPDLDKLIKRLAETGKAKSLRKAFEARRKQAVPALLKALRAPNPNIRSQAAQVLNRMKVKSKAFTQALSKMVLSDSDPDVRGMAGRVMVYYRNRGNTAALAEALLKDGDEGVRMHAAWALGASHDRAGTAALIHALEDKSTDVRLRTVGALKRIKAKKAVPWIVSRLSDDNAVVRERALEVLKKLTGKSLGTEENRWRKAYKLPGAKPKLSFEQ